MLSLNEEDYFLRHHNLSVLTQTPTIVVIVSMAIQNVDTYYL